MQSGVTIVAFFPKCPQLKEICLYFPNKNYDPLHFSTDESQFISVSEVLGKLFVESCSLRNLSYSIKCGELELWEFEEFFKLNLHLLHLDDLCKCGLSIEFKENN